MNKFHVFLALFSYLFAPGILSTAEAALFSITFYEQTGNPNLNGHNFFDDYTFVGAGTFEIEDTAVAPNNLVMFSDPAFLSFTASLALSTGDSTTFTLGIDDFEEGNTRERGLLFDGSGAPFRFDRPNTVASNARSMCEPICEIALGLRATLSLLDADPFNTVFLDDGSFRALNNVPPGTPFTPLAGNWTYGKGTGIGGSGSGTGGFYRLSAIPVPAAVWLFASALLGLIQVARR